MTSCFQLIYVSRAAEGTDDEDVSDILDASRIRNTQLGITGMLLFADAGFIQVLEGTRASVEAVFASIARDIRHREVTVLIREDIAKRGFPTWSMGFERLVGQAAETAKDVFVLDEVALKERLQECALEVRGLFRGFMDRSLR